jgi:RHS repeat-associated protein
MNINERPCGRYCKWIAAAWIGVLALHAPLALGASGQKLDRTQTLIKSSLNPTTYGQGVTFTARVSGTQPSGAVTFMDGAAVLAQASLVKGRDQSFTAVTNVANLSAGTHAITAVYGGDRKNQRSISPVLIQQVSRAPSATAFSAAPNPGTFGQAIVLSATVSAVFPSGSVTFMDGATALGSAGITSAGAATFSVATLAAGAHRLTAVYSGDTNNLPSTSSAMAQVINKAASTTSLTSTANPAPFGQSVTFTASISGQAPSGSVTFADGAITLGVGSINAAVATFSSAALTTGSHTITASYAGDTNNAASSSAALMQTISAAASTTTLSVTPNPALAAQSVTLLASVTGANPSGSVTFTDAGATLGTASINAGAASFSLNGLPQGAHTLAASYSGDAANAPGTSEPVILTVSASSANAFTWKYGYDAMGRLSTTVDPNGQTSYLYYDSLGRAIQSQQPPNTGSSVPTVIQMGYDLNDSLTSVVDPRSLTTTYTVTGLATTKQQNSPDTASSQFTYDAKGNLLTSTDARGKPTRYSYDSLDRVTRIAYATGAATVFEYDGGANPTPAEAGELTQMTDESGQSAYTHDALGRLTAKSVTIGGKTFTVNYSWGEAGPALDKPTAMTYPSGSRVNYGYDVSGFVNAITVTETGAGGTTTLLSNITYNADNNPTGWLWSDGKAKVIGYDGVGQVASYTLGDPNGTGNAAGSLRSLVRDNAERIIGYTHTNKGTPVAALNQTFGYDNLNRLTSGTIGATGTSYSYDATGNRTSKTIGGTTYANTVDATSNKFTQTQDVGGTTNVQYDAAGHMTSDGTNTYTYNDRGRMSSATTPSDPVSFLYNGLNQRVSKSGAAASGGNVYYLYDEAGQLLGEYDNTGAPTYETIYLGSSPVGVIKQGVPYNVDADQIDTPRVITKQDHAIVWRWDTAEAFGATAPNQDPSGLGVFVFNQRFPGQVADTETGLFQNWNREYNARFGHYAQSDPIGLKGGIDTYAYVEGNPVSLTDPVGLTTYMCTKPLHALGDKWGPRLYPESRFNPSPLYHQFVCVPDGKGGMSCGGQDRAEGPFGPGKPSRDTFMPESCKPVDEKHCVEKCLLTEINNPNRPDYALIGGGGRNGGAMNCQQWADRKVEQCQQQCKAK